MDLGIEYRIKDLGILCDRSYADNILKAEAATGIPNVFRLKAVSNINRLFGPKPVARTMKEGRPAMLA